MQSHNRCDAFKFSIVPDNGIAWRVWLVRIHTLNRNEGCERRSNCRFVTIQHLALFATLYFFHASRVCERASQWVSVLFICAIAFKFHPFICATFLGADEWKSFQLRFETFFQFSFFSRRLSTFYGPAIIWYEHVMVVVSWEKTGLESSFFLSIFINNIHPRSG